MLCKEKESAVITDIFRNKRTAPTLSFCCLCISIVFASAENIFERHIVAFFLVLRGVFRFGCRIGIGCSAVLSATGAVYSRAGISPASIFSSSVMREDLTLESISRASGGSSSSPAAFADAGISAAGAAGAAACCGAAGFGMPLSAPEPRISLKKLSPSAAGDALPGAASFASASSAAGTGAGVVVLLLFRCGSL